MTLLSVGTVIRKLIYNHTVAGNGELTYGSRKAIVFI